MAPGCFARSVGSSLTWPVVGVVLALVAFDGLKDGVLLPLGRRVGLRAGITDENARTLLAHLLAAGALLAAAAAARRPGGAWSPRCAGRWRGWSWL